MHTFIGCPKLSNIIIHSKYFYRFWFIKTTRITHHNQLLLTKFEKNFVILNWWRQNVCHIDLKKAVRCRLLSRWPRKPRDEFVLFLVSRRTKREMAKLIRNEEIFWMNNKAIFEFGFRRIWKILEILKDVIHLGLRPRWITPYICPILHIIRKPILLIIAKAPSSENNDATLTLRRKLNGTTLMFRTERSYKFCKFHDFSF